ncbi:MAG: carbohydrate binding family 9 domain-containing protein [Planctomycetes bacterium]|nr:carbohydrate binding family 9 domain-containing protein [Planctomycetota bacterium]
MRAPILPLVLFAVLPLSAQDPAPDGESRRQARIGRIEPAAAPRIDGWLEDPCWAGAPAIGELTMVEPWEGREPTNPTTVKLLHDRHALYIALWCDDRDPASIRATQRARDARLDPDDRVELMFDPFENRSTAYFFQIGPGGSLGDILVSANGSRFEKPWDAIWSGEARVTARGWQAEIAIPFRSIPRKAGATSWGFNLRRIVRTANEEYQWASPTQSVPFFRVSEFGTITGFGAIDDGIGVDVVPFAAVSATRDPRATDDDPRFDPDAGGDVFYRITPELTLAATLFTDFAETEDDERQINLDRFPLFFPEKRDFFLEGSSYFSFGPGSDGGQTTFLPFFSRRIGLDRSGNKIPLLAGVKVTGEVGPWELGVLDVETESTDVVDERNLAVVRVKRSLGEQTALGILGTAGRPTGDGANGVVGADFYHRFQRFFGDLDLQVYMNGVVSQSRGTGGDGESFQAEGHATGREWQFRAGSRWTAVDFDPALGFVQRRGTRHWYFTPTWQPRLGEGHGIRNFAIEGRLQRFESWSGDRQEIEYGFDKLGVELHSGDEAGFFVRRRFQAVTEPFDLFDGSSVIAIGDYWTTRYGIKVESSEGRPWNVIAELGRGDFFDGDSTDFEVDFAWRTGPLLHLALGYETAHVDLGADRSFTTQIGEGRVDLHFSPRVSLRTLAQYDNESRELGWQSRLRWIVTPGSDFFAVLGAGWLREDDDSLVPTRQSLTCKLLWTIRF